jgi:ferredoxin
MITSEMVKKKASEFGADIVGIGDISLFEGTPKHKDPRYIAPAAKTIIALGFRILRGAFRGIESGSQYYQLPTMGGANIDMRYAPKVLRELACFLEDNGYEGAVQMAVNDRRHKEDYDPNPEMHTTFEIDAEPVAPGKPAPDVIIDHNQGAYICGLGEMGMGGFFLTPEFGPFQRFAFILTDAELEFDPVYSGEKICDSCGKCLSGCPGKAILDEKTTSKWAGNELEYNKIDKWQCSAYHAGAYTPTNPFAKDDLFSELPDGDKIAHGEKRLSKEEVIIVKRLAETTYGGIGDNYGACVCGKSCMRECFIHLEEKNVLKKKFKTPFRKDAPWKIERPKAVV